MDKALQPIPRLLNQPEKIAFWTWGEITLFLVILFSTWAMISFLLGFALGALGIHWLRLLKNHPFGNLTKVGAYWFSPRSERIFPTLPPSYLREFVG